MANFIKHVGKHGDRKVAVIFRQIPGDDHMALVVYTETLNQNIHDPLISCIESPQGQASENLGDALNRVYTKDGKIILQVLHMEGMLKKVQAEHIMMTPSPNQRIKLSELNGILNEMSKGEEAVKRLAEIDASRGLQDPKDVAKRMRGESTINQPQVAQTQPSNGVLGNNELAVNLRAQAIRMSNEAKGLLAEADRLIKEASQMEGIVQSAPKKARVKKEPVVQVTEAVVPTKTSRRKKTAVES
jgi:hypothetical protein